MKIEFFLILSMSFSFLKTDISASQGSIKLSDDSKKPVILISSKQNVISGDSGSSNNIVTVLPGSGSISNSGRAPQGSRRYINTKYIISGAEMLASGFGSSTVLSVGWNWANTTASQNTATVGNLKVYLKDTAGTASALTFPQSFNTSGMIKVIDATITINSMPLTNPFSIDIPTGGPGTTDFTSVTGNSIIVAFEYETVSALAIPTGSPTVHCNTSTANSIGTYQSQSTNGTTLSASSFRPETRFGNTLTDPFNVKAVYSYGKLPWEWGFEYDTAVYDNELLPAMVKDKNGFALKRNLAGNFPIVCTISIYNVNGNFKGNTVINFNNLNPYIIKKYNNITYDVANYTARGKVDRVIVQAAKGENSYSISGDGGYTSEKEVCRFVNCDSYNYADYCSPDDGGIGFNNASGYLAAKFRNYSQNVFPVYAIDHYFYNPSSLGNQPYRIVIFDDDGFEHPGNLIYISSILTSPAGNFSTQEVTHILNSPVNISGESNFYVGINQVSVTNIGSGFQFEDPVRDSAFFFSSTGSLNSWTDFSTDSVNCRMDISPRSARNFSLKAILEGFYNGISMIPDTAEVEIRSADFPYNIIESRKSLLNSSGTGNYYFLNLKDKDTLNVYFVFKHRNHITTWSHSDPENFNECIKTYDFSDSLSKAFGNNMKTNGSVYMIYGGDINQDGLIDGLDLVYADNDAANFSTGYLATDVNGDEIVDAADIVIVDNNAAMFISSISP